MPTHLIAAVDRVESGRPHEDDVYLLAAFARGALKEMGINLDDRTPVFPEVGSCVR